MTLVDSPAPKAFKAKVEHYVVDGHEVVLTSMPADRRRAYHGGSEPAVKSQWEIRVDGVLRGYAVYPLGFGKPWEAYSLIPHDALRFITNPEEFDRWQPLSEMTPDSPSNPDAFEHYDGRFRHGQLLNREGGNSVEWRLRWESREEIARTFPALVAKGKAPDAEGVRRFIVGKKAELIERKRKDAEDKVRYAREAAERRDELARQAAEAEQVRRETVEGLESIRDRMRAQLTNMEMAALETAISRFTKPGAR